MRKLYFFIWMMFFVHGVSVASHTPFHNDEYVFQHLTLADGLSQSSIFCMLQDETGYIWIGTNDGLNRYDGYTFKVFKNNPLDSTTISDPATTALYQDRDGYLWIGTKRGILDRYDSKTGVFKHYEVNRDIRNSALHAYPEPNFPIIFARNQSWSITSITEDARGRLWIGTWGAGLIIFNKETGASKRFTNITHNKKSISFDRITEILVTSDSTIWITTLGGGLNKVENIIENLHQENAAHSLPVDVEFSKVFFADQPESLNKSVTIFEDYYKNIWVGTMDQGAFRFGQDQLNSTKITEYSHFAKENNHSLNCNTVMDITTANKDYLWFATFGGGINRFDYQTEEFHYYQRKADIDNSLMENDFITVFIDHSGILWAGGHLGYGISKFEKKMIKFHHIRRNTEDNRGLNDDIVWSFYEDKEGNIWIGTYRGGVNVLDSKTNTFTYYEPSSEESNTISDTHIRSIIGDYSDRIWFGTFSSELNMYDKTERRFYHYHSSTDGSNQYVCTNYGDQNKPSDSYTPSGLEINQIQSLMIDSDSLLWVGTYGGGIHVLDPEQAGKTIPFTKYTKDPLNPFALSDNRVYSLYEDSNGYIWVGTFGGGLNRFDRQNQRFISYQYDENDSTSLSDNKILSIFQDTKQRLWIGTAGGGLNQFLMKENSFLRHGENFGLTSNVVYGILEGNNNCLWLSTDNGLIKYNPDSTSVVYYDLYDGLQSKEYSGGAYMKSSKGICYFGGINGFNYFNPDSISVNTFIPPVVITEIRVLNKPLSGTPDEQCFAYDENFISFNFSALDYTNPPENHYAFMLEGINSEWQYVSANQRTVNYTELPPGKYTFRVIGSNNDGIWNTDGAVYSFTILTPFWQSWWFILMIVLFIAGTIGYLISVPVLNVIAIEKLKSKLAADLHDNIGAGLTEISILCELAVQEHEQGKKTNTLEKIGTTARGLIDSMSEIVWMVNPKNDSLYALILRLKTSYEEICNHMGITFRTGNLQRLERIKLPLDYRQNLFLLFKEAINNAIKHSACTILALDVHLQGKTLAITLRDNGKGFETRHDSIGNGLKNMQRRAYRAGGSVTYHSTENEGTIITFTGRVVKSSIAMYFNNRKFSAL